MANTYIRERLPKESVYQNRIIKYLRKIIPGCFVWKAAAGSFTRQGIPDVCAIIHGRFYGFEIKRPFIGVLSEIQKKTIEEIKEAGGVACVVSYEEEVYQILKEAGELDEQSTI